MKPIKELNEKYDECLADGNIQYSEGVLTSILRNLCLIRRKRNTSKNWNLKKLTRKQPSTIQLCSTQDMMFSENVFTPWLCLTNSNHLIISA